MTTKARSVPGVRASALSPTESARTHQDDAFEHDSSSNSRKVQGRASLAHWLMMACCIAMVAGVALLLYAAPQGVTTAQFLWTATPLLACLGMHFVLHKFMGHSGHSKPSEKDLNQ